MNSEEEFILFYAIVSPLVANIELTAVDAVDALGSLIVPMSQSLSASSLAPSNYIIIYLCH